ncbi:MAG: class II fructose-bisphosphatase [Tissierellia bacterium]|nr:class II fructose-bisphosphatase [Tissierellia bacterium]
MDRNLPLNLVRVTEAAAILASKHLGRGDKNSADQAAVDGMRSMLEDLDMDGVVVIGEGEMDEAPMLYIGEHVGRAEGNSPKVDIAVDPVDGTELVAKGASNAIAVIAAAPRGTLLHAPDMYMDKLAAGPTAMDAVHIDLPVEMNIRRLAKALNKDITELIIAVLDRPRHAELIRRIRETGARIKLFGAGDIASAISTCFPQANVDMMMGIGGAPEGVIAAAAMKAMGGVFQGRLIPEDDKQIERCKEMGIEDINKIWEMDDLVSGDDCMFAATGVTDGDFLRGVVQLSNGQVKTYSVVMRAETGTIRFINAIHKVDRKPEYAERQTTIPIIRL